VETIKGRKRDKKRKGKKDAGEYLSAASVPPRITVFGDWPEIVDLPRIGN